ncbi:MAG: polysaccharide biosynthesis C-terminal domain-containing protein [Ignavibacteria bacterium]|nr:polysaccharide biosynthesis C-terminal domain-containing protein [Ignavibacteria bacterium]
MGNIFGKYTAIISASKYVLLLNITDKIFSFLLLLLFARILEPDSYGAIVTIFTLSLTLAAIFDLGLPIYMQRQITIEPHISSEIFSAVFSTGLLIFFLYLLAGSAYFLLFYSGLPFIIFIIVSVTIYSSQLVNLCNRALSAKEEFNGQFYAFLLPRVIILAVFLLSYFYFALSIEILLAAMLAGFILNLFFALISLNKNGVKFSTKHFSLTSVLPLLFSSLPLGLAVVFNYLYDKIDILIISKMLDFSSVAYYNIGYGLFKGAAISFSFILVPAFSRISGASRDKAAVNVFFKEYTRLMLVICIAAAAAAFFLADWIIQLLYTERFATSGAILKILAPAIIAAGMNNLTGTTLNGMGYFKIVMFITLYALVLNVVLNILFIPRFGIHASAVISVITEYFIFIVELYYLRKILRTP